MASGSGSPSATIVVLDADTRTVIGGSIEVYVADDAKIRASFPAPSGDWPFGFCCLLATECYASKETAL